MWVSKCVIVFVLSLTIWVFINEYMKQNWIFNHKLAPNTPIYYVLVPELMFICFKFIKVYSVGVLLCVKPYFSCFTLCGSHAWLLTGGSLCLSGSRQGCLLCDQKQTDSSWYDCCHELGLDFSHRLWGSLSSLPSCPSTDRHRGQPFLARIAGAPLVPAYRGRALLPTTSLRYPPKVMLFRLLVE